MHSTSSIVTDVPGLLQGARGKAIEDVSVELCLLLQNSPCPFPCLGWGPLKLVFVKQGAHDGRCRWALPDLVGDGGKGRECSVRPHQPVGHAELGQELESPALQNKEDLSPAPSSPWA